MEIEKKKENKFDNVVADLDEQEAIAQKKSEKVVKAITGNGAKTKEIHDKKWSCPCGKGYGEEKDHASIYSGNPL